MPTEIIVEDGTGLATATSYATRDQAWEFLSAYGPAGDGWLAVVDANAETGHLIAATQLLDYEYSWFGKLVSIDQALGLPRQEFTDGDGRTWTIQKQLLRAMQATSLLALRLYTDRPAAASRDAITSERFLDYAVTYGKAGKGVASGYPEIDQILAGMYYSGGLSSGGAQNARLVRWS